MGWGTIFNTDVYINRKHFDGVEEIEAFISEKEEYLEGIRSKINALVFATPKDVTPPDQEPIYYLSGMLEDWFEEYEEGVIAIKKASLLLDKIKDEKIEDLSQFKDI